jgi:glycosyltransferase involved in cell wall biosynthesis
MLKDEYKVSVIMPVYNAQKYIERAVKSVINLLHAGELIIIDDGSSDDSLQVARNLKTVYKRIRLLTHKDNKNHGPAQTRNLGIRESKFDYVSFLDADDYYLPNRFDIEAELFSTIPQIDAVYGFTLANYESAIAKQIFEKGSIPERTTFSEKILPQDLFKALMLGGYGCFHTSGITIKKSLLKKTGVFNTDLRYGEDTELWYKLSLNGKLVAGSIHDPIAVRWVHEKNSIHEHEKMIPYRNKMHEELFSWMLHKPLPFEVKNLFFNALLRCSYYEHVPLHKLLFKKLISNPDMLFTSFFFKKLKLELSKR